MSIHVSLREGAPSGRLQHPYDNLDMKFDELKEMLTAASNGKLERVFEKLDGQALMFTYDVGLAALRVGRNSTDIKKHGIDAVQLAERFAGRGHLADAFNSAFKVLNAAISSLPDDVLLSVFGEDGRKWYNVEVIYTKNPNVINYDNNSLVFHQSPVLVHNKDGSLSKAPNAPGVELLAGSIGKMQKAVSARGWRVSGPVVVNLKKLADGTVLRSSLQTIDQELERAGLSSDASIKDYLIVRVEDDLKALGFHNSVTNMVARRIVGGHEAPTLDDIKKRVTKEQYAMIREIVNDMATFVLKKAILPIELAIHRLASSVLSNVKPAFVSDPNKEANRLQKELSDTVSLIRSTSDKDTNAFVAQQLSKMTGSVAPIEGIVFTWKGSQYKFTSNFAMLNQILGLLKYDRNQTKTHATR